MAEHSTCEGGSRCQRAQPTILIDSGSRTALSASRERRGVSLSSPSCSTTSITNTGPSTLPFRAGPTVADQEEFEPLGSCDTRLTKRAMLGERRVIPTAPQVPKIPGYVVARRVPRQCDHLVICMDVARLVEVATDGPFIPVVIWACAYEVGFKADGCPHLRIRNQQVACWNNVLVRGRRAV